MKFKVKQSSDAASHPFGSILPAEHLGEPDHVKGLLRRLSKNDLIRLHWMLNNGIVTEEQIKQYAEEIKEEPLRRLARIEDHLEAVLKED
jgi:hypothetical protein